MSSVQKVRGLLIRMKKIEDYNESILEGILAEYRECLREFKFCEGLGIILEQNGIEDLVTQEF